MTVNRQPIFTKTPELGVAQISVANTARDGTGTIETVVTGATDGTRIERVLIKATGVTTGGMVRLFTTSGVNTRLIEEIDVTAVSSPSGTVQTFSGESIRITPDTPLILPNQVSLKASTHNAEQFNVFAMGGDYN